jgi:hypothetical protein
MTGAVCIEQANALADKLTKAGENFVSGLFFTAGYDPPFRLTGALTRGLRCLLRGLPAVSRPPAAQSGQGV